MIPPFKSEFRSFNSMLMDRTTLTDMKCRLRNAQSLLMDCAAAYEKGSAFADAQRCRQRSRDIIEEIEAVNEKLAALPIILPTAARAT
jgi:hypothetical protein